MGVMSTNWWGFPPWSIMSICGKNLAWGRELVIIPSIIIETCCFSGVNLQAPLFSSTNQWEFGTWRSHLATSMDRMPNWMSKKTHWLSHGRVFSPPVRWGLLDFMSAGPPSSGPPDQSVPRRTSNQRISEDIPGRMPDRMSENMSNKCHLVGGPLEESNFPYNKQWVNDNEPSRPP